MALFVTVLSGERASTARPILAISDQAVVSEMLRPLGRLGREGAEEGNQKAARGALSPHRAARGTRPRPVHQ